MFLQSCFIKKNTPELREKLKDLGYRVGVLSESEFRSYGLICNKIIAIGVPKDFDSESYLKNNPHIIDCKDNEKLFLAIAALRDDSDKNQYFVIDTILASINPSAISYKIFDKGDFIKCMDNSWFIDLDENGNPSKFSSRNIPAHKATVEELIEYFKNE